MVSKTLLSQSFYSRTPARLCSKASHIAFKYKSEMSNFPQRSLRLSEWAALPGDPREVVQSVAKGWGGKKEDMWRKAS